MLTEIWAAIRALPEAVKLLNSMMELFKTLFGEDPKKFIRDSAQVFADLKTAKTPSEKEDAARKIHDLIARL